MYVCRERDTTSKLYMRLLITAYLFLKYPRINPRMPRGSANKQHKTVVT